MLTQMLIEIQGLEEHRERLYTTIAELFSNALEHGVLGLDSQLKSTPEGFAHYYTERERLLEKLKEGLVHFHLRHQPLSDGGRLIIEVWDSGDGFNFHDQRHGQLATKGYSGRGIGLIRQMCEEVQYFKPGNHVCVSYLWTRAVSA
jgi:anti-sigma regulatory factor (Ser/Thr protein kinase)